jgi:hypothetical protein
MAVPAAARALIVAAVLPIAELKGSWMWLGDVGLGTSHVAACVSMAASSFRLSMSR